MKLKYLCILFGVFYSVCIITAPTKNKSKRNTRTRSTSKRRPTQRKTMSRGRSSSRGMSRGGGSSAPSSIRSTHTPGMTPSPITPISSTQSQITPTPGKKLEPLKTTFFDQKIIKLDTKNKESIKKTKERLQEIKNKLEEEKTALKKLQKSLENKPKTIKNKEIIEEEDELDQEYFNNINEIEETYKKSNKSEFQLKEKENKIAAEKELYQQRKENQKRNKAKKQKS